MGWKGSCHFFTDQLGDSSISRRSNDNEKLFLSLTKYTLCFIVDSLVCSAYTYFCSV